MTVRMSSHWLAQAALGVDQPGFADLLDLVRGGIAYVKLAAPYRNSDRGPDYPDVTPFARALIADPQVLLADEPTGNLDQSTGREILAILRTLNRQQRLTIVMVTHDLAIAEQADRVVRLVEGRVSAA